jgi:hypothetical protein
LETGNPKLEIGKSKLEIRNSSKLNQQVAIGFSDLLPWLVFVATGSGRLTTDIFLNPKSKI